MSRNNKHRAGDQGRRFELNPPQAIKCGPISSKGKNKDTNYLNGKESKEQQRRHRHKPKSEGRK